MPPTPQCKRLDMIWEFPKWAPSCSWEDAGQDPIINVALVMHTAQAPGAGVGRCGSCCCFADALNLRRRVLPIGAGCAPTRLVTF